jgi:hypothetical protein
MVPNPAKKAAAAQVRRAETRGWSSTADWPRPSGSLTWYWTALRIRSSACERRTGWLASARTAGCMQRIQVAQMIAAESIIIAVIGALLGTAA